MRSGAGCWRRAGLPEAAARCDGCAHAAHVIVFYGGRRWGRLAPHPAARLFLAADDLAPVMEPRSPHQRWLQGARSTYGPVAARGPSSSRHTWSSVRDHGVQATQRARLKCLGTLSRKAPRGFDASRARAEGSGRACGRQCRRCTAHSLRPSRACGRGRPREARPAICARTISLDGPRPTAQPPCG